MFTVTVTTVKRKHHVTVTCNLPQGTITARGKISYRSTPQEIEAFITDLMRRCRAFATPEQP